MLISMCIKIDFQLSILFHLCCCKNFFQRNIETCISKLIVDLDVMEFQLEAADSWQPFLYLCHSKSTTHTQENGHIMSLKKKDGMRVKILKMKSILTKVITKLQERKYPLDSQINYLKNFDVRKLSLLCIPYNYSSIMLGYGWSDPQMTYLAAFPYWQMTSSLNIIKALLSLGNEKNKLLLLLFILILSKVTQQQILEMRQKKIYQIKNVCWQEVLSEERCADLINPCR